MFDPESISGIIQILVIAVLVWGLGIIFGTIFLYRFIRDFRHHKIQIPHISARFWVWLVAIIISTEVGIEIGGMNIFSAYPIMQILCPQIILFLFVFTFHQFKPVPKQEWLLILFATSPLITLEVIRLKFQRNISSDSSAP
jgi:cytochrome c oxidase assembly factor CtaG